MKAIALNLLYGSLSLAMLSVSSFTDWRSTNVALPLLFLAITLLHQFVFTDVNGISCNINIVNQNQIPSVIVAKKLRIQTHGDACCACAYFEATTHANDVVQRSHW